VGRVDGFLEITARRVVTTEAVAAVLSERDLDIEVDYGRAAAGRQRV
jgi:hypothetical protein